jgi:hypothetical protein
MRQLILAVLTVVLSAASAGAATRYVNASSAAPSAPYLSWPTAAQTIQDAIDVSVAGDVILVSNGVYATGGRAAPGHVLTNRVALLRPITVRSVGGPTVTMIAGAGPAGETALRCAYLTNGAELSGFTLSDGATRLSDDGVCYTDNSGGGAFLHDGGRLSNCVVRNGSANLGGGVFSLGGEVLNCTIEGNSGINPPAAGGGIYAVASTVRDCLVRSNSALYGAGGFVDTGTVIRNSWVNNNVAGQSAGGLFLASGGTAYNCMIRSNDAVVRGGGAYTWLDGTLRNTLVHSNRASDGGGVFLDRGSEIQNCTIVANSGSTLAGGLSSWITSYVDNTIVAYNHSPFGSNYVLIGSTQVFNHSFMQPVAAGTGNFSGNPRFVADYRISTSGAPYENGVVQPWMAGELDLDGRPRIYVNQVDMGAFEINPADVNVDTDADGMPDWWEWQHYAHVTNAPTGDDDDGDGMTAIEEWIAGTEPTNSGSYFQVAQAGRTGGVVTVTWPSVAGRVYDLRRITNLLQGAASIVATNIAATPPVNTYVDAFTNARSVIYRLDVRMP